MTINEEARLRSLRTSLLVLALFALPAIIPTGRMPGFLPGDIPVGYVVGEAPQPGKKPAARKA